jgi:hypothetical protein
MTPKTPSTRRLDRMQQDALQTDAHLGLCATSGTPASKSAASLATTCSANTSYSLQTPSPATLCHQKQTACAAPKKYAEWHAAPQLEPPLVACSINNLQSSITCTHQGENTRATVGVDCTPCAAHRRLNASTSTTYSHVSHAVPLPVNAILPAAQTPRNSSTDCASTYHQGCSRDMYRH